MVRKGDCADLGLRLDAVRRGHDHLEGARKNAIFERRRHVGHFAIDRHAGLLFARMDDHFPGAQQMEIAALKPAEERRSTAAEVMARARRARPDARIEGVTIQPMIARRATRELILGFADDPTFGPVVVFGHGGTAVEVVKDKALALPPLGPPRTNSPSGP